MFSHLTMMYASYVLQGKWDINNVPPTLQADIEQIVADMTKKPEASVE